MKIAVMQALNGVWEPHVHILTSKIHLRNLMYELLLTKILLRSHTYSFCAIKLPARSLVYSLFKTICSWGASCIFYNQDCRGGLMRKNQNIHEEPRVLNFYKSNAHGEHLTFIFKITLLMGRESRVCMIYKLIVNEEPHIYMSWIKTSGRSPCIHCFIKHANEEYHVYIFINKNAHDEPHVLYFYTSQCTWGAACMHYDQDAHSQEPPKSTLRSHPIISKGLAKNFPRASQEPRH